MACSRGSVPTCSALMLWSSTIIRSNCEARSQHRWLWLQSPRRRVRTSCVCWATVRFPSSTWAGGAAVRGRGGTLPGGPQPSSPSCVGVGDRARVGALLVLRGGKNARRVDLSPPPHQAAGAPTLLPQWWEVWPPRAGRITVGMVGASSRAQAVRCPPPPCSPQPVTDSGYRVQPLPRGGGHFKLPHSPGSDRPPPSWLLPSPACFPYSFLLSVSLCPLNCTEIPVPGSVSREPTRTTGF